MAQEYLTTFCQGAHEQRWFSGSVALPITGYFFAWRAVKVRYKQTVLGVAWAILKQLLIMTIFLMLFRRFAKIFTDDIPTALFYYTALIPWAYLAATLSLCSNSLLSNANLLTKVYFPRTILPAAVVLSGLITSE